MKSRQFLLLCFSAPGLRRWAGAGALAFCLMAAPAWADDKDFMMPDIDQVVPMAEVVSHVHKNFQGQVLKIKLKQKKHSQGWRYEVKLLTQEGNVMEVELDALTLAFLGMEGEEDKEDGFFKSLSEKVEKWFESFWK